MIETYSDIPRLYTALAEWLYCVLYIVLFPRRWGKAATVLLCGAGLSVQAAFLILTVNVPLYLWLPVMAAAVVLMYVLLALCTEGTPVLTGYHCAKAFLVAEFAAALEWQLDSLLVMCFGDFPAILKIMLLPGVYGAVFYLVFWTEKKMQLYKYCRQITGKETLYASSIAVLAFLCVLWGICAVLWPFMHSRRKSASILWRRNWPQ